MPKNPDPNGPTPADLGYSMPAEWEPHARCWMAWPYRPDLWVHPVEAVQKERENYNWPEFLYYPIDEPSTNPASVKFMVGVMKAIKQALDPQNIMNPGKTIAA